MQGIVNALIAIHDYTLRFYQYDTHIHSVTIKLATS